MAALAGSFEALQAAVVGIPDVGDFMDAIYRAWEALTVERSRWDDDEDDRRQQRDEERAQLKRDRAKQARQRAAKVTARTEREKWR